MEQAKKNREWIKKLSTGRDDVILESLKELRFTGNNDLLPVIINLLKSSSNRDVHREVLNFLNDLKHQSSVTTFVESLNNHRGRDYFAKLVGACWQNGLDYSGHTEFFIDIVLNDDYAASIEAFTVIEGNITQLDIPEREKLAEHLDSLKENASREKGPLLEELIEVMKPFSGPFSVDRN